MFISLNVGIDMELTKIKIHASIAGGLAFGPTINLLIIIPLQSQNFKKIFHIRGERIAITYPADSPCLLERVCPSFLNSDYH